MTLEHIWPQALGGGASPSLFRSERVCERCNNLAGLWVDGAFMKSFFMSVDSGLAIQRFLDPERPGPVPLIYMGEDQEFPVQPNELCERWVGPSGEHIYFVHLADDDKWFGFAGGDVLRRRKDRGRVYFYLTSGVEYWAITGLLSIIQAHSGKRLFSLTELQGEVPLLDRLIVPESEADPIEAAEIAWIRSRSAKQGNRVSIRLDFADRFLAKLAIGIGHNLLGDRFINSEYADRLRQLLWRRPSEDLPDVLGAGFWSQPASGGLAHVIGMRGAWTIVLRALPEGFLLMLYSPSGREMTIGITDDVAPLYEIGLTEYAEGVVYYVVPARSVFAGPFQIDRVLMHRSGGRPDKELAALDAMRVASDELPAKR